MLTKEIVSELEFKCIPPNTPQFYSVYKRWVNDICIEVTIDDETKHSYVELVIDKSYRKLPNVNDHHSLHRLIQILS
jgi:hypothetical protein